MEKQPLTIFWTEPAKKDLQAIFDYLSEISMIVAEKQVFRILDRVGLLEDGFTEIGQKEPLLDNHKYQYRYLVQDNYKVIYHLMNKHVVIDMVFDTRQNPKKMKPRRIS